MHAEGDLAMRPVTSSYALPKVQTWRLRVFRQPGPRRLPQRLPLGVHAGGGCPVFWRDHWGVKRAHHDIILYLGNYNFRCWTYCRFCRYICFGVVSLTLCLHITQRVYCTTTGHAARVDGFQPPVVPMIAGRPVSVGRIHMRV